MLGSVNREALGHKFWPAVGTHLTAGALGGMSAVIVSRFFLEQLGLAPGSTIALLLLGLLLLFAIARDLGVIRLPSISTSVQVPKDWRHSLPTLVWSSLFGWLLGFTFLTRTSSSVVQVALISAAAVFESLVLGLFYGAIYGLARTSIVLRAHSSTVWPERNRTPIVLTAIALLGAVGLS